MTSDFRKVMNKLVDYHSFEVKQNIPLPSNALNLTKQSARRKAHQDSSI